MSLPTATSSIGKKVCLQDLSARSVCKICLQDLSARFVCKICLKVQHSLTGGRPRQCCSASSIVPRLSAGCGGTHAWLKLDARLMPVHAYVFDAGCETILNRRGQPG